tara:strand:- start:33 stop:665 length:633 start_codon:yes stop_codon:yes gene_type:complete
MKSKKCLIEIIEKKRLSIKHNPFGINRLWPNSYVQLFYNSYCNKIYESEKSPNILEVNQLNSLNLEVWDSFFDTPNIENHNVESIMKRNFYDSLKYDIIIINNKYIVNDQKILLKLKNLLKAKGIIIVEDIGRESKKVINIYINLLIKYNIEIYDYRFNRLILNNCLLLITKRRYKINIFNVVKNLFLLFKFLINEFIISLLIITFKKTK